MGISRSNFRYAGTYTCSSTNAYTEAMTRWAMMASTGNGGSHVANTGGGEAMFGSTVPHSYLDGTAPASAGDYCLGYMFGQASQPSNNNYSYGWNGAAFITTGSDSGALFPVDASPSSGTAVAYSLRAFLRVDDPNSTEDKAISKNQGSAVGLFVKGVGPGTAEQGDYIVSPTGSLSASYFSDSSEDATDAMYAAGDTYNPRMTGYCLSLSTLRDDSDGANGGNSINGTVGSTIVRLKFGAHDTNNISHSVVDGDTSYHETVFSGAFGTWYHVRMDVTPNSSFDKVEIYSAPIANALGSESWTKHSTVTVNSTDKWYRPWDSTGSTLKTLDCGFFVQTNKTHTSDYLNNDVFIDNFEFFTKDVS